MGPVAKRCTDFYIKRYIMEDARLSLAMRYLGCTACGGDRLNSMTELCSLPEELISWWELDGQAIIATGTL